MQYMFLIYSADDAGPKPGSAEFDSMMAGYGAFTKGVREAGVMKEGAPLQGVDTATTVRVRSGKTDVIDGPFAAAGECYMLITGRISIEPHTADGILAA